MSTKPPHHVPSQESQNPHPPDLSGRILRNEPNSHPANSQSPKAKSCFYETNPISPPHCHPERRAAERSAAAQSRGTCSITIAEGDSKQTPPAPKHAKRTQFAPTATSIIRNEPNFQQPIYILQYTIPWPTLNNSQ